ncbi:hypothetical protein EV189_3602 [Motilibacter rhizosphaerae]|uniref:DUF4267 domain-containing protein n=1 Tax=Motilibacter rhizosphaerae TaxID=598652 RepID=A0A4Q7NAY9_9ACTN|nr:hypothetical protein [Motilibacter rhizosphaerae]RZS80121.1 hypothetical protein EV189_3602 [Motilibacter rhizosphaerae]
MEMRPDTAARALAAVRLVNGALGLVAPAVLLHGLGTDARADRSGVYPFRMFGIRTVVLGVDLWTQRGAAGRDVRRRAVLIHGSDAVIAAVSGLRGDLPRRAALMTTTLSTGNTVLALLANRDA